MTCLETITKYCHDCIDGRIPSCEKHKWACQRFLNDISRIGSQDFPYVWDEDEAQRIVDWFKLLRHSKGDLAGHPIELTPWEMFRECQIYGWRHKDLKVKRFKRAFTEVARKNAKSQLESGEALYGISVESVADSEVHEVYTAGTKRDQSKIVFDECDLMTRGTLIRPKFKFNRSEIVHLKTGSFIKPLSKQDGKTGDGTNPYMLVLDEYKDHETTEFYDLGMGSNTKNSMLTIITTAGPDLSHPCFTQEYPYCSDILNPASDIENDSYFVDILEMDHGDDPAALTTWQKANPVRAFYPGGVDKLREAYKLASEIPEKMVGFKTKMLDVWVMAKENGYMDMAKWKACETGIPPIKLEGQPVYVGFDLSSKIDLTSVAFVVPYKVGDIVHYYCWQHSFIPTRDSLQKHISTDKVPYDAWVEEGYLTLTDTQIVDQQQVMDYALDTCKGLGLEIKCLCFDPANAGKIMMDMSSLGYDVEEVYQSHRSLNESTQTFREQVYAGNVSYPKDPLLNFAMGNAQIRTNQGLIKIDKDSNRYRIDPVDALLCAFKLALYHDFTFQNYGDYVDHFISEYM